MANILNTVRRAFDDTATGDGRAFVAMLADDVEWTIIGTTDWSRTFKGKPAVVSELLRPLSSQFHGPNTVVADRIVNDGDCVVVEGRNLSTTKSGLAYPNRYCWVMDFLDGKVVRLTEYCDTALIERVLAYPAAKA